MAADQNSVGLQSCTSSSKEQCLERSRHPRWDFQKKWRENVQKDHTKKNRTWPCEALIDHAADIVLDMPVAWCIPIIKARGSEAEEDFGRSSGVLLVAGRVLRNYLDLVQSPLDHDPPGRHCQSLPRYQALRRQPRADARSLSGLSGACHPRPWHRRTRDDDDDALGHTASTAHWRPARDQHSQRLVPALAPGSSGAPLPRAREQLCRIHARAEPGDEEDDVVWFALAESRPLFAFAGIWTTFNGNRETKSKPVPGTASG